MKRLKWILCLLSILTVSLSVVACGGSSNGDNKESQPGSQQNTTVVVTFDPCMSDHTGLKTNTPSSKTVKKGEKITAPTIRALENPENLAFGGWYTSKDFISQWNFDEDVVTSTMTLYAKWVKAYEVNYYLTDGETCELKRNYSVADGDVISKEDSLALGYELLGYYKDEALTEEFDFNSVITQDTNVYIKRSSYVYLDAQFIASKFKPVASNAGKNGASFGGMTLVEEGGEKYVDVDFGYCPDAKDPHIILENFPLVINKSQKLEITFKLPGGSDPLNALVVYVTSLYEDKTAAVFSGANEEMAAAIPFYNTSIDNGWVTMTIDLDEKLYGGASIWANSTYLGLLRLQLQYKEFSANTGDTHHMYIKSIKGVADDSFVTTADSFEDNVLVDDDESVINSAVSTVQNGFSFPADRDEINGNVVNGESYNKEDGLLVYMPYRTVYNELKITPSSDKVIDLNALGAIKLTIKNLGYIPYVELKFENTDGSITTPVQVELPSQMEDFETYSIDLSDLYNYKGTLKNVIVAANSKGIDNAYIIKSIEFVEYITSPVTGFDFVDVCSTSDLSVGYDRDYKMFKFDALTSDAGFEMATNCAISGYTSMSLGFANPDADITGVLVTLTINDEDYGYELSTPQTTKKSFVSVDLDVRGVVTNVSVKFVGCGTIYLESLSLGFENGIDLTDKSVADTYVQGKWINGMYDSVEGATVLRLGEGPAMLYLADAQFANLNVSDSNRLYIIYQNRTYGNQPLTISLFGADTINGLIAEANQVVYYLDTVKQMSAGEWAVAAIDISTFAWDYISVVKFNNMDNNADDLYVRAVIVGNQPYEPVDAQEMLDFTNKEHADAYLNAEWVKGRYDESEGAIVADLAIAPAMFYLAPGGLAYNYEIGENTALKITYQIRGEITNQPIIVILHGGNSLSDVEWTVKNGGDNWKDVQRGMSAGQWATLEIDISAFGFDYISVIKIQAGDAGTAGEIYIKDITLGELSPIPDPEPEPEPEPEPVVINGIDLSNEENANFYLNNEWVRGRFDQEEKAIVADLSINAAMFYLSPTGAKQNLEIGKAAKLVITYQIRGELTNQPIIVILHGGNSATDSDWTTKKDGEYWKDVQRSMSVGQWATLEIDLTEFNYDYISVIKLQAGDGNTAGEMWIKSIALDGVRPINGIDLSDEENANFYLNNEWLSGRFDQEESAIVADLSINPAMFYLAPTGAKENVEVGSATKLVITYQIRGELTNQPIVVILHGGNSATDSDWTTKNGGDNWKDVQRSMSAGQWATLEIDLSGFDYDYISVIKLQAGDGNTAGEMWIKSIELV